MLKKCIDSIRNSQAHLEAAERMSMLVAGVVGENRLLAKVLTEMQKSASFIIDSFIYYEAFTKKIKIPMDREKRAKLFFDKIAAKYLTEKQIDAMKIVLKLTKKHKNSHLEFVKKDKFVIFDGNGFEILTSERLKALIVLLNGVISGFPLKT